MIAVVVCYAFLVHGFVMSVATAAYQNDGPAGIVAVICHVAGEDGSRPGDPAGNLHAKHHCVLCQGGSAFSAARLPAPETLAARGDVRTALVIYGRRQDPATAPLYLPPRVSRGPPLSA